MTGSALYASPGMSFRAQPLPSNLPNCRSFVASSRSAVQNVAETCKTSLSIPAVSFELSDRPIKVTAHTFFRQVHSLPIRTYDAILEANIASRHFSIGMALFADFRVRNPDFANTDDEPIRGSTDEIRTREPNVYGN